MIARGPIKMLHVIGKDFAGFELEALWEDGAFGLRRWHDFSHIAVVTDHAWMRTMVSMFKPFFHGNVRLFGLAELPAAKDWIASAKRRCMMGLQPSRRLSVTAPLRSPGGSNVSTPAITSWDDPMLSRRA